MNDDKPVLSSEQALDDYFGALLSDDGLFDDTSFEDAPLENVSLENDPLENAPCDSQSVDTIDSESERAESESSTTESPATESSVTEPSVTEPSVTERAPIAEQTPATAAITVDESELLLTDGSLPLNDVEQDGAIQEAATQESDWQEPTYWMPQPCVESAALNQSVQSSFQEVQVPNLDDVERLLSQLEESNPLVDAEVEQLLEQNNAELQETLIEAGLVDIAECHAPAVEEIQEWEPEVLSLNEPELAVVEPQDALDSQSSVDIQTTLTLQDIVEPEPSEAWANTVRQQDFQVLYFEVNGVTFAVPLDELGGIHRLSALNQLLGRPEWYLGLQTSREQTLDVVDTARWAMPERLNDDSYKQAYQYVVMLGASQWGLASSQLLGTEWLSTENIRWREQAGKRPWLAGMVTEKMCALIHVEAMINMLNAGLDVKSLN